MIFFLLKKLLILSISFWCVITATFFLMHSIPGDPFIGEGVLSSEILNSLHTYYGLDRPLLSQYFQFLQRTIQGDFGTSIVYSGRPVSQFIGDGFPVSAYLGLQALCIALPFGCFLGTLAASYQNRWQDRFSMLFVVFGVSIPNFVLAACLQYFFCIKWQVLPIARLDTFAHTLLPSLSLALLPTAFIARLARANMIEVLQQDYIRTALAKGIPFFRVALQHGLRNAFVPVLGYLTPVASHILMGSFMIEKMFAIPGLGQWMIHSIQARDYPMIAGLTMFCSLFFILFLTLTDLLYFLLDPRIRIYKTKELYA